MQAQCAHPGPLPPHRMSGHPVHANRHSGKRHQYQQSTLVGIWGSCTTRGSEGLARRVRASRGVGRLEVRGSESTHVYPGAARRHAPEAMRQMQAPVPPPGCRWPSSLEGPPVPEHTHHKRCLAGGRAHVVRSRRNRRGCCSHRCCSSHSTPPQARRARVVPRAQRTTAEPQELTRHVV